MDRNPHINFEILPNRPKPVQVLIIIPEAKVCQDFPWIFSPNELEPMCGSQEVLAKLP